MDIRTLCVQPGNESCDRTGAVSVPIYQSATFAHPGVGQSTGFDYARTQNPTREHLEQMVAKLEGGVDAMAFSTGMAAITALMELFGPGDHIIATDDLYGGSLRLFNTLSAKHGLQFDYVDTGDLEAVRAKVRPGTRAIFVETVTNPTMQVTDLRAVGTIARETGAMLIVDNTFLTPYLQRPIELGADIVMHSGTKYLGGHNDTLAGFLVVRDEEVAERLRFIYKTIGACLAPLDSWLLVRGIKTLALRMQRQEENAHRLAHWLLEQKPYVRKVYYAGLEDHPGHAVMKEQSAGFGAMISFVVDCEATAHRILERVRLIQYAESLGGVESLITYPMLQTHADVPEESRRAKGIDETLLRFSVGIEAVQDLIDDLAQALKGE